MKIAGHDKVVQEFNAKYKQPFPRMEQEVTINGIPVDLAVVQNAVSYTIDGVEYSGYICCLLNKDTD